MAKEEFDATALAGSEAAFAEFYRAVKPRLWHYVYCCAGNAPQAEEQFQETFRRFLSALKQGGVKQPARYLFVCARNVFLDHLKREGRREAAQKQMRLQTVAAHDMAQSVSEEECAALAEGIGSLPPEQREVLALAVYDNRGFQEIAELTGESYNTVVSRYRYALAKVRQCYEEKFHE